MYRITVTDLDTGTETQREDVKCFLLVTTTGDDTIRNLCEADQGMDYGDIARVCIGAMRTVKRVESDMPYIAPLIKGGYEYDEDDDPSYEYEVDGNV